jgi:tripartite-type tricarboxylate transporter receptor subunit TctC
MNSRYLAIAAALGLALAPASHRALAQGRQNPPSPAPAYPTRTVKIVVPFAAGGSTDVLARLVGQMLSDRFGQQFIVENVGGAGGTIGAAQVARAAPDGYTVMGATPGPITINPAIQARTPYDPLKDFAPIALVGYSPVVVVVKKDSPVKTLKELITLAKTKPDGIVYGSAGHGSFAHLSAELFKSRAGINMTHVAYRGTAPAVTDLVGGRLDVMFENYPSVQGFISAGELRAIAIGAAHRPTFLPDVPTASEEGVPGYESSSWFGLLAPAGTPRPVIDMLNQAIAKGLREPALTERLSVLGVEPVGDTPDDFAQYLAAKVDEMRKLVKENDIKIE